MSKFQSFAFVASVVGAALMTGAASAQTAAPVAPVPVANAPPAASPAAIPWPEHFTGESETVERSMGHQRPGGDYRW